jgi:ribosomal protein S18 acetylase RimI-like enzyme
MKLFITILFFIIIFILKYNRYDGFTNVKHPDLLYKCFSNKDIDTFKQNYTHSKIIYGENKKGICYITPTKVLNDIPIISWNGYYINNFCVEKKYRRKGYGKKLISKIISMSKKSGIDHLILQVDDNNKIARKFYEKYGFFDYFKGVDKNNSVKIFMVKYL